MQMPSLAQRAHGAGGRGGNMYPDDILTWDYSPRLISSLLSHRAGTSPTRLLWASKKIRNAAVL